jgi:hypothetical protein
MKEVVRPMLEASQTLAAKTRRQGPPNYRRILFEGGYCVFSGGASANVDVNVAKDQIAQMLAKTETGAGTFISLLGQAGRRSAASIRT